MWQPRGLDYSLYTVLSRHHSRANDFSFSVFSRQENAAAGDFSRSASSATVAAGSADDAVTQSPWPGLLQETVVVEERGLSEAEGNTVDLATRCENSCTNTHQSPFLTLHHQENHEAAGSPPFQNGVGVSGGTVGEIMARVSRGHLSEAMEPPVDEDLTQIHKWHAQGEEEQEEVVKFQEEMQLQQGRQGCLPKQRKQQHQKQMQQAQLHQQKKQERQEQDHRQRSREPRIRAYLRHVSSPLRCADDATEGDAAREPHRCISVDMKREYTTRLGDGQSSASELSETSGETTACVPSSFSPLLCRPPFAEPLCSSDQHATESNATAAAVFCPTEGYSCGTGAKTRTGSCTTSAAANVPPSVVAITSTASTTSDSAADDTNTEPLTRLASAPVVPSFRVLILFGSTSGVSAAVAFSIFHTFVHRLLSSVNRVQGGGYSADRQSTYRLGPVSPSAARPAQQTSPSLRLHSASSEKASATSILAAASSSFPRGGARVVHPVLSTSEDAPADFIEGKDSLGDTATRQSEEASYMSVATEALPLNIQSQRNMTNTSSLPSASRRERPGETFTDVNDYRHHETGSGEVSGEGLRGETTHPQQHELDSPRQQHGRQQDEVGGSGKGEPHADCDKTPQKVRGIRSQWKRQEFQPRSSAPRQKQQKDQQVFPHCAAGLRRKSNCSEDNQPATEVGEPCAFRGGPEVVLEKREAAAQAAEVASMGLKAAAAIASAALKAGEQRDAARRAAVATSAARDHCKEEPKKWFMDDIQVGRVGVYIQSMQYFTFEDLLEFVDESRVASSAGAAATAAIREAAGACAVGRTSCRTEVAASSTVSSFPGAVDTLADAGDERASSCLCGSGPAGSAVEDGRQCDLCSIAFVRSSDCGMTLCSAAKLAAGGADRTFGDDDLSRAPHTLILYCISTNMGGAPPDSAASFYSEVLEAADDFRVGRGSLRGCCVAGVGCGSTDYPQSTYCRPARQLMTPLHRLGARVLMQQPLLLLTDTSAAATTEMKLAKWRQQLVQHVERLLQASDEEDVQQLLQDATKGANFSRQKQYQQHYRQQLQQPHRSQWPEGDHEACKDTTTVRSASCTEVAKMKEAGSSRLQQGHATAVLNAVSTKKGIASQNTVEDFLSMTESSYTSESDEQSDLTYGEDDDDDDNRGCLAGETKSAKDQRVNPSVKRRTPTFSGVGSNMCGGSGDDDVEDMVGAEALTEDGAESNSDKAGSLQVKQLQADKAHVRQRRTRAQLYGEQADQKTDERDHGTSEHTPGGEVRKKRQQRRGSSHQTERAPEKMIKPRHAEQLSKEGYRLIGSHSAVKLCRWTKSQLRGRGGCYKHTFYGITSSQCMEMTPSLACANKCIFCWRHHKNPVGTSWRWQMDDAAFVVNEAITQHFKAIKELKGMAEVKQDRLDAARANIRHCALSLVGEPIMYPRIDALVKLLHEKCISTFLVTNAQFPDALARLPPVTQLYLSVDAASARDLKALDQPLFSDYWERFTKCMDILRSKRQRTVYRLTLVAGYNMPDLATLGQSQSEALSGAHQAGKQHDGIVFHPSSDEGRPCHTCRTAPSERIILRTGDKHSHGGTTSSACPCGDTAATTSPTSSVLISSSTAALVTCLSGTFTSKQEVETKDCSPTVGRDRAQDFTGRSATDYAALVSKGLPDFIEVKAVTYAGTSKHSKITMKNIPWHDQVIAFCKDLCAALPKGAYEMACAHRHSCCVLIAKTEYKKNGQWHTWINYDKFHELAATGRADFAGTDYCAPTPDWAIFGHAAAGFSPFEARIYTKGKQKRLQVSAATAETCQA